MTEPVAFERLRAEKGWLDRSLSIVTEVQAGEGAGALLLATNIFLILGF